MVSFLRSATWRLIFLGKAIKETTKGLYAWYRQETSRTSTQVAESTSLEVKSKDSWRRSLRGVSVLIVRKSDWYELEAYGPIQRIVIICSNLRMALEKMVEQLDHQADQYALEQRGPEWWDVKQEDFVVETKKTRH